MTIAYNTTLEKEYATSEEIISTAFREYNGKIDSMRKIPEKLQKESPNSFFKNTIDKKVGREKFFEGVEKGILKKEKDLLTLIKLCCEKRIERAVRWELDYLVNKKLPAQRHNSVTLNCYNYLIFKHLRR